VNNQRRIAGMSSWEGNSLGLYSENATGTIYAETKDDRNKYWYFVRMNNEAGLRIHSNRFTHAKEVEDAANCFYYGWVSVMMWGFEGKMNFIYVFSQKVTFI
jgi:hypothetical protein